MDEQKFREGINVIGNVLKVFVAAKKDNGRTFVEELNKSDKDYISSQLEEYRRKKDSDKKVNGIRVKILDKILKGGITFEEVCELFEEGKAKDGYGNRGTFGILYSLYYNRYKPEIVSFIEEIKNSLKNDIGSEDLHYGYNHFDGGQNQGKEKIYMCVLNKCWNPIIKAEEDRANKKEILSKIKQFRIETVGDDIFRVGMFTGDKFVNGEYKDLKVSDITYQELLDDLLKYKDIIINDTLPDVIEYIKENISNYSDIKEKAEQERKEFNEKYPLEKLKELPLEQYNYGMGNANSGSFTWSLNTDYAIAGWLFSNGQNWLFFKEGNEYKIAKNMSSYLNKGNGDIKAAFEIYKNDLYNFVKNFDINTYNPNDLLPGANYIKAALLFLYKGDFLVTLGLKETCYAIANALNLIPGGENKNLRQVDFIEYDKIISDHLKEKIPDIIDKYGFSAIGKCLDKYYETFLMKRTKQTNKEVNNKLEYYAVGADLGYGDKQDEFYSRGKLIIGWYEIGDLSQFETEEELLQKFKECKFSDTESHFKQTFSAFKQIKPGDIVCVKSVYLQKKEMYIYAVGEVLQGYDNGYEYLDGLGHSLPVKWKILNEKHTVNGAKYQKTLTKIQDDEIKHLLDKLLGNTLNNSLSSNTTTMIDLNTILYGVPGTGKTYNTVNYAVAIIENKSVEEIKKEPYEEVKKRYDNFQKEGQIVFTTFHQSFGYEDFIEGIKAEIIKDNVNYDVESGIFKKLCDTAIKNLEDSKKTVDELIKENSMMDNMIMMLNDASTKNTQFSIKKGAKFYVEGYNDEYIYIKNPSNEKTSSLTLKISDLITLLNYSEKITKSMDIVNILGYYKNTRQEDSYILALYDEYNKHYNKLEKNLETKAVNKKKYVIIIDEINRGNISKIFGELITLIEPNKRLGEEEAMTVKLPYSNKKDGKEFGIPNNVYILGTMNTADRSIALIDLALRRRFKFKEIAPNSSLLEGINVPGVNVKSLFETLNNRIEFLYDRDHLLGHAYFLPLKKETTLEKLNSIMLDNIIPLLQEYFHDDWEKIQLVLGDGIIKSEMVSARDLGINSTEYEEEIIKYTINTNLSAQDYQY